MVRVFSLKMGTTLYELARTTANTGAIKTTTENTEQMGTHRAVVTYSILPRERPTLIG